MLCVAASGCLTSVIAGEAPLSESSGTGEASTSAESPDEAAGESTSGGGPLLDVASDTEGEEYVDWLLNSENGFLHHINRESAHPTELCELINPQDGESISFSSMTFSRDDRLFGSGADELWEVVLPECEVLLIGAYGGGITGVNGITPDEGYGLFAVDSQTNALYRVDPDTAEATLVGGAGYDIGFGGATWVETEQKLMAIDAQTDNLYEVDTETGLYTLVADLTFTFGLVGFEYHPHGGQLYACTDNNGPTQRGLYEVHLDGSMGFMGDPGFACNDLAAPWAVPELPTP